ncbi:hypothetical protein HLB23_24040 [Nocardia uniformis]|uniref:Uncharacterized protein n=1 Tax=Nocardia uniformis TaxID=53432 RepID=A0A849CH43_9NOCA|nr:hypothetical protein [Nocardia uniformis]NNH72891.1 hypothetical protein [Nocardia uniformis]
MGIFRRRNRKSQRRDKSAGIGTDLAGEAVVGMVEVAGPGLFRLVAGGLGRLVSTIVHAVH